MFLNRKSPVVCAALLYAALCDTQEIKGENCTMESAEKLSTSKDFVSRDIDRETIWIYLMTQFNLQFAIIPIYCKSVCDPLVLRSRVK